MLIHNIMGKQYKYFFYYWKPLFSTPNNSEKEFSYFRLPERGIKKRRGRGNFIIIRFVQIQSINTTNISSKGCILKSFMNIGTIVVLIGIVKICVNYQCRVTLLDKLKQGYIYVT